MPLGGEMLYFLILNQVWLAITNWRDTAMLSIRGKLDKYSKIEKLGTSLTDHFKTVNSTQF